VALGMELPDISGQKCLLMKCKRGPHSTPYTGSAICATCSPVVQYRHRAQNAHLDSNSQNSFDDI
jgi:hypothetical protein